MRVRDRGHARGRRARALRERDPRIACFLVDPPGSGLYNKVTRGVMYTWQEAEGKRLRNPFDTITEGVGINRLTANFAVALGVSRPVGPERRGTRPERRRGARSGVGHGGGFFFFFFFFFFVRRFGWGVSSV